MGMSVKGATQHRLVRDGMKLLLGAHNVHVDGHIVCGLSEHHREACQILIRRADLALDRIKTRKLRRAMQSSSYEATK